MVTSARPELGPFGTPAILVAALILFFGTYRFMYLMVLVQRIQHGSAPPAAKVRGAALRSLFLLGGGAFVVVAVAGVLRLVPGLGQETDLRYLLGMVFLALALFFLAPAILALLWRSKPLADEDLLAGIRGLAERADLVLPRVRVLELDGLDIANAWVAGPIERGRTIFLTRGLLERLDRDEVLAIVGHELGHVRLWHLPFYALLTVASFVMAWGLGALLPVEVEAIRQLVRVSLFLTVGTAAVHAAMRRCERAADRFGAKLTGDPATLARALRRLVQDSRASRWTRFLATHPDVETRLRHLAELAATAPRKDGS